MLLLMIYWQPMIEIKHLSFTYPGTDQPVFQDFNAHISRGELCLVTGPSGAGKSTLLRCLNGLVPHFSGGSISGSLEVGGLDPVRLSPREMSRMVGFVFQDPEAQFVVDCVEDEIAFSLENASMPPAQMDAHISEALQLLEITGLRTRRLDTLSGGERQRVAIAAALVQKPSVLVLDEPTSQLDPHTADEVLQRLLQLNEQLGLTIVLAEHRLERVLPYTRQVIYLSHDYPGGLVGAPRQVLSQVPLAPPVVVLGKALGWEPLPLTVDEARNFSVKLQAPLPSKTEPSNGDHPASRKPVYIHAQDIQVNFGPILAVHGVSLSMRRGEITVLMGPNGSGKTTLLRALIGLVPTLAGTITVDGQTISGRTVADICQQVGYLPQNPNALLFADTVLDELLITLRNHKLDLADSPIQPDALLGQLGLSAYARAYPRDLSAGERQRVAIGAVTITHPGALLLDEPTRGLDYASKQVLLGLLNHWRDEGMAILLVTHDVELAAQVADEIILLDNGQVVDHGLPGKVLSNSSVFSPQVAKVFPGQGWITVEEALGGLDASQY
jgi:energy-coupling factor transport system ATP-binding protein